MYPFQDNYEHWCKTIALFSDTTISQIGFAISSFFSFQADQHSDGRSANNVRNSDIHQFVVYPKEERGLRTRTVNKYISYLKTYFKYLYQAKLIDHYPLMNIKGLSFDRHFHYVIGWHNHLIELIEIAKPETIKLLLAVLCGYKGDNLLTLTWADITPQINNTKLLAALEKHPNFPISSKQYLFQDTRFKNEDHRIKSFTSLNRKINGDEEKLGLDLSPTNLWMSFCLSNVLRTDLTDQQLMEKLHCNQKTLSYYRSIAAYAQLENYKLPTNV